MCHWCHLFMFFESTFLLIFDFICLLLNFIFVFISFKFSMFYVTLVSYCDRPFFQIVFDDNDYRYAKNGAV